MENNNEMIACVNCGKKFLYDSKRHGRKFCDENCRIEYYGIKSKKDIIIKKVCKFCQKPFECSGSHPNKEFCSQECSKTFHKNKLLASQKKEVYQEKRKCAYCGKEFVWSSNKSWQKYCGLECREAATKLKIKNYNKKLDDEQLRSEIYLKVASVLSKMDQSKGASFNGQYIDYRVIGDISEKTREEVLNRDAFECQICKRKDSLHLHHLIKRRYGGKHTADNLITLCASCHRHIETRDLEHATNTCFRNAKRHYGAIEERKSVDIDELRVKLTTLFAKLTDSSVGDDTETMILLDEILDSVEIE